MTTYIKAPDENDSFCRVVLDGNEYLMRFTYNASFDYWSWGLYEDKETPIVTGIKIVPNFPLTFFYENDNLPNGVFGCLSDKDTVGRYDFVNESAVFIFIPSDDLVGDGQDE